MADLVWRGLAATCMFAVAGISDPSRLILAVVGVTALSLLDGLAIVPLWLCLLAVLVLVRRPSFRMIGAIACVTLTVAGVGALAGWQAAGELRSARQELSGLQVADIDGIDELDESLSLIDDRLDQARSWIDAPWVFPARYLPMLGSNLRAADEVIKATALVFDSVKPLRSLDLSDFAITGGADLTLVAETSEDVSVLAVAAADAEQMVADIDRAWLLPGLDDELDDAQEVLADGAKDAERLARMLRGVWRQAGGQRPQTWFVLLCSPAESRASCGFPGNYVVIVAIDGRFDVVESGRISDIEQAARDVDVQLTIGGDYQARYEQFGVAQTWRNITMSPHWPDVADAVRQLYGDITGTDVDVVVGVNTEGLAAIMELTGPVEVGGLGTVSADNARQVMEIDQYATFDSRGERVDALSELTGVVVDSLLEVSDLDATQLRVVADAAEAGGIVVHAADDPERLFAEAGIDGALPEPAIGVTWQNAAANKLDVYMHTAIAYHQPGETDGCVVFTMRNDAPEGLPDVVAGVGEVVPPRWQRSWISIYSPNAVRTVWLDGEESEFSSEVEHGSFVVALFVDVGPGQVTEVIARLQSGAPGSAMVRVQPASLPTEVTVLTQDECEGDPP